MRLIYIKTLFGLGLCLSLTAFAGTYSGGDGLSEATAYLIANANDLAELGTTPADLGGSFYFRQTADINLSAYTGTQFHRIGYYEQAFRGTFDGNGFAITNFTYEDAAGDYIGFFGYVLGGTSSTIKNVKLVNVHVTGQNRVGALIGSGNCLVQNCSVEGGTVAGNENVGGLLGYAFYSISNCSVNATVSGSRYVGGIAGYFSSSGNAIDNCHSQGSVTGGNGSMADVGGITGRLYSGTVRRCTSEAAINATGNYAGGIVGSTFYPVLIEHCYAADSVSSTHSYTGGVAGDFYFSNMLSCRSSGTVQGLDYVGGVAGNILGNSSQITDCVASGDVSGRGKVGGFAGRLVVNSGTVTLLRCGANNFNVTTQTPYGGGLVGEIQANSPGTAIISQCFAYPDITADGSSDSARNYQAGLAGSALRATITNCSAWGSTYNGYQYSGGLVGSMTNCTVTNCYSIGNPSGIADVGGLIGKATNSTISNSFWDQWTSGETTGSWGTPKTTTEMQTLSTFTGWDFVGESISGTEDVWRICIDGSAYPKLVWWSALNGDFVCPDGVAVEDLQHFASQWLAEDCAASNNCQGADLNNTSSVDFSDFAIFADHWLEGF